MTIAIQILVLGLIILSTISLVTVPVILASPGGWEKSKNIVYTSAGLWSMLVIITGIANLFIT